MSPVKFPMMRLQVAAAVAALSDPEYQQRVWIGREWPVAEYYDDAEQAIQWLCENTLALEAPESLVGEVLFLDEVPAMSALAERLVPLVAELGVAESQSYLADPRWAAVVEAAARARRLIEGNGGFPMPALGLAPVPGAGATQGGLDGP